MLEPRNHLFESNPLLASASRRDLLKRAMVLGLAIPVTASLLAACGDDDETPTVMPTEDSGATDPTATSAASEEEEEQEEDEEDVDEPEPTAETSPPEASGDPVYGGTLNVVHPNDFVTMWPMFTTGPTLERAYDWLCVREFDGETWVIAPSLAESWELSETAAIFNLREGIKFHDGTDLDAEAVRWNVEMWVTHPQSLAAVSLEAIDPENPAEVIDDYTVQVNLTSAAGSLLNELSDVQRTTGICSPAAYERLGEEAVRLEAVGTGPFIFENWVTGNQLTVRKNPDYWQTDADGNQLPYVDGINYRWISDDSVRLIEMRSQVADFTFFVRGRDIPSAQGDPNLNYFEHPASGGTMYRIFFNGRQGPFAEDKALRQAVQYAINRDAIAEAVGGGLGFAAQTNLLPGSVGYSADLPYYTFDLDRARELRAESDAPAGLEVRITIITREADQQMAQMIQQMLGEIDINVTVEGLERVAWGDQVRRNNDFEVATQRTEVPPDPDQHWSLSWAMDGPAAYTRAVEPEIWDLIEQGRASFDRDEREAIYFDLQTMMHESAWWGNIWVQPANYLANNRVKGIPVLYMENFAEQKLWLEQD